MKKYNVKNYIRYKEDVKACMPDEEFAYPAAAVPPPLPHARRQTEAAGNANEWSEATCAENP